MSAARLLDVRPIARLFKALSDETRIRVVALLAHGESCVCDIETGLDLPQPMVSRHLAVLRSAGVVETRREGSWVYYRLAPQLDDFCREQLATLVGGFAGRKVLHRDVERLLKSKGPGSCV